MNEFESPALPVDCYLTCPIVCFFIPLVSNGKLFIVLSSDTIEVIANLVTILAFPFAVMAFLNWKKALKYERKIGYVMHLEDRFEILMHGIALEFNFFADLDRNLLGSAQMSGEHKSQLCNFIENSYQEYKNKQTLTKDFDEYGLAILQVKRYLENLDKECEVLSYSFLHKLSCEGVSLSPKWIDKNNPSDEPKRFSEKINKAREDGVMYLRKIYK